MAWVIADTHFNHEKIIDYCDRPFSTVEEMNKYIISKWNSVVNSNDIVYHLGDFALHSNKEVVTNLVNELNGSIILIRGNHDRFGKQKYLECGFLAVYKSLVIDNYILSHRPEPLGELNDYVTNIHGHIHNYEQDLDEDKYINVSCEVIDYKPIWINLEYNKGGDNICPK